MGNSVGKALEREDLWFWGLLVAVVGLLVRPLWIGPIPPLTDFGGHAAMADVWSRLEQVHLFALIYERNGGLVPNLVMARFVGWVHPWLPTMVAARLWTTGCLVATVAAVLYMAAVFGRSRWLIFVGLPFLWGGALVWGLLNYLAVIPLFFVAVALAREAAGRADWRYGVALAVVCVASFFAHGVGCVFVVGASVLVVLASADRPAGVAMAAAVVPATALWVYWRLHTAGQPGLPPASIAETVRRYARWWPAGRTLVHLLHYMLDSTQAFFDTAVWTALTGAWMVLMCVWAVSAVDGAARLEAPRALRAIAAQVVERVRADGRGALREYTLVVLGAALAAGMFVLPVSIKAVDIDTRLVPLFVMVAAIMPRLSTEELWRSRAARAAMGIVIASAIVWGVFLARSVRRFERTEVAPMVELIDRIPPQSRVQCLGVHRALIFHGYPLNNNCPGLVHVRRSGFGGFTFPATAFNAVKFRPGHGYASLAGRGFNDRERLRQWDYVLVRGAHRPPPVGAAELVATARAHNHRGATWYLYRVVDATPPG